MSKVTIVVALSSLLVVFATVAASASPVPGSTQNDSVGSHCDDMFVGLRILTLVMVILRAVTVGLSDSEMRDGCAW